ncbi:hypothetical protein [Prescottella agglutinans]|uniref:Uncharacterized protein n=1 Tax=Prescottella agglutinans TaxID=1644129 RepID=A0ABT6MI12_9NOCA|nr:hypothetical protein [Prescottella agglutinans]MDH6283953.1 hypothetical protein [Prescottella agglutinans]
MSSDSSDLAIHVRVNRLFAFGHSFGEPEQSSGDVAAELSRRLGREVDPAVIDSLRTDSTPTGTATDSAVLAELASHFGAPAAYLTGTKNVHKVDQQLRLVIAARDAQANGVCFRAGGSNDAAVELMISELEKDARHGSEDRPA